MDKFLLVGDKFVPEMHLKQPGFTYSGPFTKNKERIEKFLQTGNTNFIYRNELDKACFQHDMAYGKSKDLAKKTQSDKVLRDKAFKIASDPKYDGYQRGLASMVYKFFDKKSSRSGVDPALDPACPPPPFKIFVSPPPLFCPNPFQGILDSSSHPYTTPSCPNPTNQPSLVQTNIKRVILPVQLFPSIKNQAWRGRKRQAHGHHSLSSIQDEISKL